MTFAPTYNYIRSFGRKRTSTPEQNKQKVAGKCLVCHVKLQVKTFVYLLTPNLSKAETKDFHNWLLPFCSKKCKYSFVRVFKKTGDLFGTKKLFDSRH